MTVLDYFDFTHDSDRQALKSLEAVPGFKTALKAYMRGIGDRAFHMQNMSQKVLLGPNQLSRIYNLLPPICDRFGIEEPPLFLEYNPYQNAYTWGDNIPFITVTSGLLENMNDEEIQIVLAHECGHIVCHHVLYHTMGNIVLSGASGLIGIPIISDALSAAFCYWMRCSEFSADRASALFCGDAEKVSNIMLRLSGVSKELLEEVNLEAFMSQAASYYDFKNSSDWNSFLNFANIAFNDHPLNAVRAAEVTAWANQPDFVQVCKDLDNGAGHYAPAQPMTGIPGGAVIAPHFCPKCHTQLMPNTTFCPICGVAATPPKRHCAGCGSEIDPNAAFCSKCGQSCPPAIQVMGTATPNGMAPYGMAPNGAAPNGMPPNGMPPNGMAPNGMAPNGMPPYGMPAKKTSTEKIRQNLQGAFRGAENAALNAATKIKSA